jgi:ArsR family transcriptional regulator
VKTQNCDCEVIHEEAVNRVRESMPCGDSLTSLANLYKMLADNTRLKILWALSRENMCVCDLAVLLNMTKSAISHQLKSLRLTNIVKCDRKGKIVLYSLADDHVKDIFERGFEHVTE